MFNEKVHVLDHPLLQHKLTILRDERTGVKEFREIVSEIAALECYEATRRPKGENIRLVMERNGLAHSIYVGDTQGDRDAAQLAGIPFIYARYGFGEVDGYDHAIDSLLELPELIARI